MHRDVGIIGLRADRIDLSADFLKEKIKRPTNRFFTLLRRFALRQMRG